MKCPRCGREIKENETFCPVCGFRPEREDGAAIGDRNENTQHTKPKGGRIVLAVLSLLLYVGLMFGCQSCVMSGYMTSLMLEEGMITDITVSEDVLMGQAERLISAVQDKLVEILLISNLLTLLIICLMFHLRRKSPVREMGVYFVNPFRFITFALFGTALNVFFSVTIPLLPLSEEVLESVNAQFSDLYSGAPLAVQILTVAVVTPVVEELIFRGLGMTRLSPVVGSIGAAVITSLVFGFAHGTLVAVLYAAVMGMVFALMYVKYNSVIPSLVAHAFFNLASFWLAEVPEGLALTGVYLISIAMIVWCAYRVFVRYPTFNDILSDRDMRIRPVNQTEADIMTRLNTLQQHDRHDLEKLGEELEELEEKWNENRKNYKNSRKK